MDRRKALSILMLAEYFHPHAVGGSAQSTYYLATSLIKKGHKVRIITPNYGSKSQQIYHKIKIHRFKIGKKFKQTSYSVTPFWHSNIWWWFNSLIAILRVTKIHPVDIIHIQGKYFLPAAVLAGKLRGIPLVFTARDYQTICSLGLCLWQKSRRCSNKTFMLKHVPKYNSLYLTNANSVSKLVSWVFHLRGRVIARVLGFFSSKVDQVICISNAQKKIFSANGFINTQVIYNSSNQIIRESSHRLNQIVYVGRLTPGKGAHLLIPSFYKSNLKDTKLIIVGKGLLKNKIIKQTNQYNLTKRIELIGKISHKQVIDLYSRSKAAIFPSVWPEPFGRGAMEAIFSGTPVITSNKGGLPEIVQKKYGLSVNPTVRSLSLAIKKIFKQHSIFVKGIMRDSVLLTGKFNINPINQYESLYYKLLK